MNQIKVETAYAKATIAVHYDGDSSDYSSDNDGSDSENEPARYN